MDAPKPIHQPPPSIADAMREVRTKSQLARLLQYLRIKPSKSLGQNFLVDHNLLDYIVREAGVGREDVVLDIGCGTGLLTAHLADAAGRVIGIELHRGLFAVCSRYMEGRPNVTLLCGDALASKHELNPALVEAVKRAIGVTGGTPVPPSPGPTTPVPPTPVPPEQRDAAARQEPRPPAPRALRVVSNLPYSAASLIVPNLLESGLPIAAMVVTVQKEVGERMTAVPGSPGYGALSLVVQVHGCVEVIRRVPPEVFWPRPKVDSCIVRVRPGPSPRDSIRDYAAFKEVVRAAFAHRRKTLANSLAAAKLVPAPGALLAACGIPPAARAQDVDLSHYILLANQLSQTIASWKAR